MKNEIKNKKIKEIRMMVISGEYTVPEEFYNQVKRQVETVLPALQPDMPYTLEMLCGPEFWKGLNRGERILAGRCMATIVTREELPLDFVGCPHANPKKYKVK